MLITLLIILASILLVAVAAVAVLVVVMRRPALVARLMRYSIARRILSRVSRAGIKAARKKAERSGTLVARDSAAPVTDLELVLSEQSGPEAERAKAMLAGMNPRQRREISRLAMGSDGLEGMMESSAQAGAASTAVEMLGRSERRRVNAVSSTADRNRSAQKKKAVAKRRAKKRAK